MYYYLKALHLIFIVTWFSGLFYIVRLFVYHAEANARPEPDRSILMAQFQIMIRRLWFGITWPSAVLTLVLGPTVLYLYGQIDSWMWAKLAFVFGLYGYHFSLHAIYRQQARREFRYSSNQLRIWNEVATLFLVAIVMLVVVKSSMSLIWGLGGLVLFTLALLSAIRIYKIIRERKP